MKKVFALGVIIAASLLALCVWQYYWFNDSRLHIVFCNVGQGDGIFIRTPDHKSIILDGGPDAKVLSCLSAHMPFWDRNIDIMLLSHPHLDHFVGLESTIKRYTVVSFATENLINTSFAFTGFRHALAQQHILPHYVLAGDTIKTGDGVVLHVLAPDKNYLAQTSPGGTIGETGEFGSLVLSLSYGNFKALFTSDAQTPQLLTTTADIGHITLLQVPHHGSRTGLVDELLARLSPAVGVISVGKNNRYGHPHKEVLDILAAYRIQTFRTDEDGEVEIITNGKNFSVQKSN